MVPCNPPCAIPGVSNSAHDFVDQSLALKEEIEIIDGGNTTVNDSARTGVSISSGTVFLSGVKARMVPFATDDDREFGPVLCSGCTEALEGFHNRGHLLDSDDVELTLKKAEIVEGNGDTSHTSETPSRYTKTR